MSTTCDCSGITIADGPFDSKVVSFTKAIDSDIAITINALGEILDELEKIHKLGAIFVRVASALIPCVEKKGYTFHHFENGAYVFYKWNVPDVPDKVPAWATSMLGVSCLILSPDQKSVLMIYEYGKFKAVTGVLESGHLFGQTCFKEVEEETGINLDPEFGLHICGGGILSNAKLGVTDAFLCFVAKAQNTEVVLDKFEIKSGVYQWFSIDFLIGQVAPLATSALANFTSKSKDIASRATIEIKGTDSVTYKFNPYMILALRNYVEGRSLPYHMMGRADLFY